MAETYTYIARSLEHPERTLTFTLRNDHLSVDLGTPVEQVERVWEARRGDENGSRPAGETDGSVWLKPLAISLLERGVGPFYVGDVSALAREDQLRIKAWYRAGGLGLLPITLLDSRIDNPQAAHAFVQEIARRKEQAPTPSGPLVLLDYWLTWLMALAALVALFSFWRSQNRA